MKTFTKNQMIAHFFTQNIPDDVTFLRLPGEKVYRLDDDGKTERELERMMTEKKIVDYVTFEHITSIISDLKDFLTPAQVTLIANEIEDL